MTTQSKHEIRYLNGWHEKNCLFLDKKKLHEQMVKLDG